MALMAITEEPYVDHIHATPEAYMAATGKTIDAFFEAPMLAALVGTRQPPSSIPTSPGRGDRR